MWTPRYLYTSTSQCPAPGSLHCILLYCAAQQGLWISSGSCHGSWHHHLLGDGGLLSVLQRSGSGSSCSADSFPALLPGALSALLHHPWGDLWAEGHCLQLSVQVHHGETSDPVLPSHIKYATNHVFDWQVKVTPAPSSDYTLKASSDDQYSSCLCANGRKTFKWILTPSVLGEFSSLNHCFPVFVSVVSSCTCLVL